MTGSEAGPLARRSGDLRRLADERWDLVVVGGGVVGAGILLDAASRGLRVALLEQDDVASGTSGRSSRLIHGGLRYLEQLRVHLVREALDERDRLLDLAPHLVRLVPLVFPLYGPPALARLGYGAGFVAYDLLGAARRGGRHRQLSREAVLERVPMLRRARLRGGIEYHDGIEDDARFALAVARTAVEDRGVEAIAVTRLRADEVLEERGRAIGVRARDRLAGEEIVVRGERIVDATGVWGAHAGPFGSGFGMRTVPSRGSHVVMPRARIPVQCGMTLRVPGRVVFLIPWPDAWIVGTTDIPDGGPPERTAATAAEVDWLLDTVNDVLDVGLTRADLIGTYAGLRPLVGDAEHGSTVKISREHRVHRDARGITHVRGGKYTTYRIMAADTVDVALGDREAAMRRSQTADLPIRGAAGTAELRRLASESARSHHLDAWRAERLIERHGTEAAGVLALGREHGLLRPLGDSPHLEAEVLWAARRELALSLDDVLARRTRLAVERADRGAAVASRVAEILGAEFGWDAARRAAEVASYLDSARRLYGVPGEDRRER